MKTFDKTLMTVVIFIYAIYATSFLLIQLAKF